MWFPEQWSDASWTRSRFSPSPCWEDRRGVDAARNGRPPRSSFGAGEKRRQSKLVRPLAAELVLDVGADDLVEALLGAEAEARRALGVEIARPARRRSCMIAASGSRRISATTLSPATRRSASICSPTVHGRRPAWSGCGAARAARVSMLAACIRKPTAERGLACQWRTSSGTGSTASWPASGSRMMPEKKPEAALFGLPGRTQIVGRRMPMPSKKPRRDSRRAAARRSPSACRSWSAAS